MDMLMLMLMCILPLPTIYGVSLLVLLVLDAYRAKARQRTDRES